MGLSFAEQTSWKRMKRLQCKPVRIEDDVFVGTNAIIFESVLIGDRTIIGTGSVVSCDVSASEKIGQAIWSAM